MAHFARIDSDGVVTQVIVVLDSDCGGGNYPDSEPIGAEFCASLLGGTWKQTSYNNGFRKRYAGIGYVYDESRDAFIPPKPFPSWVINEDTCLWDPPIPYPEGGGGYEWSEDSLSWVEVT